jgi:mycofactocin system transcriptional regulator
MTTGDEPVRRGDRGGRPASITAHELAEVAQRLFVEHGFDHVSVDQVAAAAGISRRTFFRYFATKADVLFVESPREVQSLRDCLARASDAEPWDAVLRRAVVQALEFPADQYEWAYQRAQLITAVPALRAYATTIFTAWQSAATDFAADRLRQPRDALLPLAIGHAVLAASLTAHEHWVAHPGSSLSESLEAALDALLPSGGD